MEWAAGKRSDCSMKWKMIPPELYNEHKHNGLDARDMPRDRTVS